MADEQNTEKQKNIDDSQKAVSLAALRRSGHAKDTDNKETKKHLFGGYLPWLIFAVVVVFCAAAGVGLGRLFGRSDRGVTSNLSQQAGPAQAQPSPLLSQEGAGADSQKTWYYDFESVLANLNEPGATRYIRVALTLQVSGELDQKKGTAFIDEKKPLLKNWLTIYLSSQNIENIRGDRNLRRIQSEILDAFNERLFPNAKPQIKEVLFKEFAIQ